MRSVAPGCVATCNLDESVGTGGCGSYVGFIVIFETSCCVAQFFNVEQVHAFFDRFYKRCSNGEKVVRICSFCTLPHMAQSTLAQIRVRAKNRTVPFYAVDSMYTTNGLLFPGQDWASAEEMMQSFCVDYARSFILFMCGETKLRFLSYR